MRREAMATQRLSRLHQRILQWLVADHQRTRGVIVSSHEELVKALQKDKGTISRSLRTLEARGWLVIGRSSGGKAHHLTLTPEGHKRAGEVAKKLVLRDNRYINKEL
jgi:DNA-binding MarR family transcriptional regulator